MSEIKGSHHINGPHHLKISGDGLAGARNHVWIDGAETGTVTKVVLTSEASSVNKATVEFLLIGGVEVDVPAEIEVGEDTARVLVALGWAPPQTAGELPK